MFMALGAGAFTTAIFHVFTHAFFKACLFLGSGSVIHAMEHMHTVDDPQDIRTMGGLRKYMPHTSATFWISTLAIAGIPLLSGFFSKDEILAKVFHIGFDYNSPGFLVIWGVGAFTAFLTAFYMTRVTYLTFNGKERFPHTAHPHESGPLMTIPLWVLGILAIVGGYVGLPEIIQHGHLNWITHHWLSHHAGGPIVNAPVEHMAFNVEVILISLSILIAFLGVGVSYRLYSKYDAAGDEKVKNLLGGFYRVLESKFYVDEIYNAVFIRPFVWISDNIVLAFDKNVVDGIVNGTASLTRFLGGVMRHLQSGLVTSYALLMVVGVVLMLLYLAV
jgi:NADH-quinone oxidoreductase subunit L